MGIAAALKRKITVKGSPWAKDVVKMPLLV